MSLLDSMYQEAVKNKQEKSANSSKDKGYNTTLDYLLKSMNGKDVGGIYRNEGDPGNMDTGGGKDEGGTSVYPSGLTPGEAKAAKALVTALQMGNDLLNPVPIIKPGINMALKAAINSIDKNTIDTTKWAAITPNVYSDEEALQEMGQYVQFANDDPYSGLDAQMQTALLSFTSGLDSDVVSSLLGMGVSPDAINSLGKQGTDSFSPESGYYGMGGDSVFGGTPTTSGVEGFIGSGDLGGIYGSSSGE